MTLAAQPEHFGRLASDPVVSRLITRLAADAGRPLMGIGAARLLPAAGLDLSGLRSVLRLIGELHDIREALGRDELHVRGLAVTEQRLPGTGEDGMNRDVEHVEQVLFEDRFCE